MEKVWKTLEEKGFKVSTDTRKDVRDSVFFCLKGENFDGNDFVEQALENGASLVVTENKKYVDREDVYVVSDPLDLLQKLARKYRDEFNIPIIVIGGSNGKTTSRELIRDVLRKKYKAYSSEGNLNNHIGVPLSLFRMEKDSEIAVFEIGANHPHEHTKLLGILNPTHVVVTNNGLDHLEGFGSPLGVREANKEIYDWAFKNNAVSLVNERHQDLMEDSEGLERVLFSVGPEIKNNLFGKYNLENIYLALTVGREFGVAREDAEEAIATYSPALKRSQYFERGGVRFVLDCYNANPTSMMLSLESFLAEAGKPRGVVLGDMLELGSYADAEHEKIVDRVQSTDLDLKVFIGKNFEKFARGDAVWFPDSEKAREWFNSRSWKNYTVLLKGSRGVRVERVIES